jgi:hypothetical protein
LITAVWFILTVLYAVLIVRHVLDGPRDGDLYVYNVPYQVAMFIGFRLPPLIILLIGILLIDLSGQWASRHTSNYVVGFLITGGLLAIAMIGAFMTIHGMNAETLNPYNRSFEYQAGRFLRTAYPLLTLGLATSVATAGWIARRQSGSVEHVGTRAS